MKFHASWSWRRQQSRADQSEWRIAPARRRRRRRERERERERERGSSCLFEQRQRARKLTRLTLYLNPTPPPPPPFLSLSFRRSLRSGYYVSLSPKNVLTFSSASSASSLPEAEAEAVVTSFETVAPPSPSRPSSSSSSPPPSLPHFLVARVALNFDSHFCEGPFFVDATLALHYFAHKAYV